MNRKKMKLMKTLKLIITGIFLTIVPLSIFAQGGPPDPPGHGETIDQPSGGNAPIGGGLFILMGLGVAYGGKKFYNNRKELLEE